MNVLKIVIYLFFASGFSQIKNGRIEYSLVIDSFEGLKNSKSTYYKNNYNKAIENAKYLNFILEFNNESSAFYLEQGLGLDDGGYFYAKIHSGYMGKVFQNLDFTYALVNNEVGKFLLKRETTKDWELINETKNINGFLCYKAVGEFVINNGVGVFHHPVIAWYCPKIPNSFGPNGFGKLPGLILELQVKNILFGVRKVELNLDKPYLSEKNENVKTIDESEFNKLIDKIDRTSKN